MLLDIIMPRYNEPWEMVRPFFDMLRCQKGVDFSELRVHIVHDGTEPFDQSCFDDMPFTVVQSCIEHGGVSAARNYGLDCSSAKWVCFCDCDDTYANIYSLKFAFEVLDTEDYDLLWGPFITENIVDGKLIIWENTKFNMVWVHNKYYRREFLNEKNIRFSEKLRFCEDSAFNSVVNMEIGKNRIAQIKTRIPMYVWCWRKDSATTDPRNKLPGVEGHFDRNLYVLQEFRARGREESDKMVGRTLTDAYIGLTRNDYDEDRSSVEKRVAEFAKAEAKTIRNLTRDDWELVMKASIKEARDSRLLNPDRPLFTDWLKELKRKYV